MPNVPFTINFLKKSFTQDSIQVGCVPPACHPYVFRWSLLDVTTVEMAGGGGLGSQVNKFEHASRVYHQMSLAKSDV